MNYPPYLLISWGGGVFIAVQSCIKSEEYINYQMKDLELICVRIPSLNGDIPPLALKKHDHPFSKFQSENLFTPEILHY